MYQDCILYDTVMNKWHKPHTANSTFMPKRKNQVAVVVGSLLVTHGGCDDENQLHDDGYTLCLKDYIWTELKTKVNIPMKAFLAPIISKRLKNGFGGDELQYKIDNLKKSPLIQDRAPEKLSHHAACFVFLQKYSNRTPSLYENTSVKTPPAKLVQFEGIYMFGGKDYNGDVRGGLYILVTGKKPCNWICVQKYIEANGPSPSARYGH